MTDKKDPVGEKYYRPLVQANFISYVLFVVSAIVSILILFLDGSTYFSISQTAFVLLVISNFVIGLIIRLWLAPRAESARRLDLLSDSYSVNLTHETSQGYFNNNETNPVRRLAFSIMESSFFTKSIADKMLVRERVKTVVYFIVWTACAVNREVDLSWVIVATQAIFSEEIISRWVRLEWLSYKSNQIYSNLRRTIQTARGFGSTRIHAQVFELFSEYEAAKARASIALSPKIFENYNPKLSEEWDEIKKALNT